MRLQEVREKIDKVAIRSGRSPRTIRLVVVTKEVEVWRVREVITEGTILGENYVQEAVRKQSELEKESALARKIVWHLLGHLQKNKVKESVGRFELIQSVDSSRLAQNIDRVAEKNGVRQAILLQVNVSKEMTKHGFLPQEVEGVFTQINGLSHVQVKGLMVIPPLPGNPEESRPHFRYLRQLAQGLGLSELSMGMSADFEVAVEEGATLVRIGTAIFGARN